MTTAITRSVRVRECVLLTRTGPVVHRGARSPSRRGGISSRTSSWTSTLCATSSAHGHHFCAADGRSNKIGTSDNFRLRVISLSCPWRPSLILSLLSSSPPPPPPSPSLSAARLRRSPSPTFAPESAAREATIVIRSMC